MDCKIWIYGPQMSITDNSYAIGGSTWSSAFNTCVKNESEIYGSVTPSLLYTTSTMYQGTPENIIRLVKPVLIDCKVFSDILLIHSAFINALGMLYLYKRDIEKLETAFTEVYNITEEMVGYGNMYRFVSPENFPKLNIRATQRPRNMILNFGSVADANRQIKVSSSLSSHPISERDQQCSVSIKNEYTVLFEKVENSLFKPLAKVISCNCSILQKPITLSSAEIQTFKKGHITTSNINMKPPILIYKDKTYLSQLFEKTCVLFYKPVEIKESVHNNTFSTLIQNIRILKNNCSAYAHGNLSVFSTPIQSDTDKSNIPVFFIENDKVDVNYSPEKSFEFFKYIAQELIDLKVFVPIKNKDTYELNNDFDIETLDCYKNFPDAAKSDTLKKRVTKYFYFFIGNIFHLFVTNHIEVPFKLNLYYGLRLFNLVDVVSSTTNQLILVSIYFLEKAKPEFVKEIIKILEDPKHLLKTKFFKIEDATVGVRMNGYLNVVSEQENRPLYSEEEYVLVNNIIEFLFRNAITDCFPNTVYNFFNGFNFTMNFDDSTKLYKQRTLPAPNYLFTHQRILEQVIKANKYMCE